MEHPHSARPVKQCMHAASNNSGMKSSRRAADERVAAMRRRPASARNGAQLSASARMNLFMLVRVLFQYLERVDGAVLCLAKEVLKDCERKHNTHDSKYDTLADAIHERVRDAVGEHHWAKAKRIQKQLVMNGRRRKMRAQQDARQRQLEAWEEIKGSAPGMRPLQQRSLEKGDSIDTTVHSSNWSDQAMADAGPSSRHENVPVAPTTVPGTHGLRIGEEAAMAPRQAEGDPHLPLRKRVMFAPPPEQP